MNKIRIIIVLMILTLMSFGKNNITVEQPQKVKPNVEYKDTTSVKKDTVNILTLKNDIGLEEWKIKFYYKDNLVIINKKGDK